MLEERRARKARDKVTQVAAAAARDLDRATKARSKARAVPVSYTSAERDAALATQQAWTLVGLPTPANALGPLLTSGVLSRPGEHALAQGAEQVGAKRRRLGAADVQEGQPS